MFVQEVIAPPYHWYGPASDHLHFSFCLESVMRKRNQLSNVESKCEYSEAADEGFSGQEIGNY